MLDGEWLLEYPGTAFSIGGWDPVANPFRLPNQIGLRGAPTVGDVNLATDDTDNPREDGQSFGADYRGGRAVTFSIACRGSSEQEALELAAGVATAWRGDTIRWTPGAYATLSTRNAGRERLLYGRPRRFVPNDDTRKTGLVTIECDFQAMDDRFYDREDTGISLGFVAPYSGAGLSSPLVSPLTSTPSNSSPGAIVVGGDLPVWPVISITGPITNPVVAVSGLYTLALQMTIIQGATVTIDTRPGRRSVTNRSGASFRGRLTRDSRLDRAALSPGAYTVSLSGIDNTGLSSMQFAWRHAYSAL